jgi:hypothetical protein
MPVSVNFSSTTIYTIPDDVFNMRVRMWGGGGGGEFVAENGTTTADGGNGGSSSWVGITCGGGQGGGVSGAKNSLGAGAGVNANGYPGASISNGGNGGIFAGGGQVDGRGNGGNGTTGYSQYSTFSFHVFDNDSNTHVFTSTSPDIIASYQNPSAPDGIYAFLPSYGKFYRIQFVRPFVDNTWTFSVYNVCNQAAGGATNRQPYSFQGSANKTANGIDLWFQNSEGGNGYIRCFNFDGFGIRVNASGRGGGAGGYIDVTISRQSLIDKGFSPGATYTATVGGGGAAGGSNAVAGVSGFITLFMYIIPRVFLSTNKEFITAGESATLTWNTTGDADLVTWTSGNINNNNLTSSVTVSPTQTTTYTAIASGSGGSSPAATVTIYVYQRPTASLSSPTSLLYGQQAVISYETQYANISIVLTPIYTWRDNTTGSNYVETGAPINITPVADSPFLGDANTVRSNNAFAVNIPYNESGPFSVQFILVATGNGGVASSTATTQIIIDQTPDNLIVEETTDVFKLQDPVFTPQTEVLSELMLIDDVDIPVEIKSSSPIQVDINQSGNWRDLRSI